MHAPKRRGVIKAMEVRLPNKNGTETSSGVLGLLLLSLKSKLKIIEDIKQINDRNNEAPNIFHLPLTLYCSAINSFVR